MLLSSNQAAALRDIANRRWILVLVPFELGQKLVVVRQKAILIWLGCRFFLGIEPLSHFCKCNHIAAFSIRAAGLFHAVDEDARGLGSDCCVDEYLKVVNVDEVLNYNFSVIYLLSISRITFLLLSILIFLYLAPEIRSKALSLECAEQVTVENDGVVNIPVVVKVQVVFKDLLDVELR